MYNISLREYKVVRNLDVDESGDLLITGNRTLFGLFFTNLGAATRYLKLYNKATAPTVGTDTPFMTIPIFTKKKIEIEINGGIPFSLGIGIGATVGVGDADNTAPGANEVVGLILYK